MLPAASAVSAGNVALETRIVTGTAISSVFVLLRLWTDFDSTIMPQPFKAQSKREFRDGHGPRSGTVADTLRPSDQHFFLFMLSLNFISV